MKNILLVEDDPEIVNLLRENFISHNYQVTATKSGRDGVERACKNIFDLIMLDIMLPDTDGMAVCKAIRERKIATPILMLTARSEEIDKVLALEIGADDYVTKPFGIRELIRRVEKLPQTHTEEPGEIIFKNLSINRDFKKACLNGDRIDLSPKEFELLLLLAANAGKTYSRQELLEKVWGYSFSGYEHTVTTHINRLRLKIEANVHKPEYILTSWGTGYRFAE
jgi:two-component system alkaline phosphatase synthesis response regulator PhoP